MKLINNNAKVVSKNACNQCTPLGACLAFKGIENSMTIVHGSQGCATYIRRYLISHFREPVDIASSSFGEEAAIFGGKKNLLKSIENVKRQYDPSLIGIATTCLSETIGDDLNVILKEYSGVESPAIVPVSTPSYKGNHEEGFRNAVNSVVASISEGGEKGNHVNLIPPIVSPEDLRHLKEIMNYFGTEYVLLPDYSDTLDGGIWEEYMKIPKGGAALRDIRSMGRSVATIEFGSPDSGKESAGRTLQKKFGIKLFSQNLPIGLRNTDLFMKNLGEVSGKRIPEDLINIRSRLVDAYADSHKYVFEAKAVVYGDPALVIGIVSFLSEIGVKPVLCATGSRNCNLEKSINEVLIDSENENIRIIDGSDFGDIEEAVEDLQPDIIIGNSKGHKIANKLNVPLIRIGFPVHDYFGGQRILHIGYRGALSLLDKVVNSLLEVKQSKSSIVYNYM